MSGLALTIDDDSGRLMGWEDRRSVHLQVGLRADHYLSVQVTDDGWWVLAEVALAGSPRILARSKLPAAW
jgi:hypothetical protein